MGTGRVRSIPTPVRREALPEERAGGGNRPVAGDGAGLASASGVGTPRWPWAGAITEVPRPPSGAPVRCRRGRRPVPDGPGPTADPVGGVDRPLGRPWAAWPGAFAQAWPPHPGATAVPPLSSSGARLRRWDVVRQRLRRTGPPWRPVAGEPGRTRIRRAGGTSHPRDRVGAGCPGADPPPATGVERPGVSSVRCSHPGFTAVAGPGVPATRRPGRRTRLRGARGWPGTRPRARTAPDGGRTATRPSPGGRCRRPSMAVGGRLPSARAADRAGP